MSEKPLLRKIQLRAPKHCARLFRNHSSVSWVGKAYIAVKNLSTITLSPGDVVLRQATRITGGLCVGASDLIGWRTVTVTPEMVGRRVAIFVAIEGKFGKTRTTEQQENFIHAVRIAGGIGAFARSEADGEAALGDME